MLLQWPPVRPVPKQPGLGRVVSIINHYEDYGLNYCDGAKEREVNPRKSSPDDREMTARKRSYRRYRRSGMHSEKHAKE
jgi:hypothetical protein